MFISLLPLIFPPVGFIKSGASHATHPICNNCFAR